MKNKLWKIVLILGLFPFVLPILLGIYHTMIESWTILDWIILYSFLYWPTYIIGISFIIVSFILRKKSR